MPTYRMGSGWIHIKLGKSKRPAPARCRAPHVFTPGGKPGICGAMSTLLCDAPVGDGTCDMPLCPEHGVEVGRDRHLCPKHAAEQPDLFRGPPA
jgi:hypothetical protein